MNCGHNAWNVLQFWLIQNHHYIWNKTQIVCYQIWMTLNWWHWCFLAWKAVKNLAERLFIWSAMTIMWRHCKESEKNVQNRVFRVWIELRINVTTLQWRVKRVRKTSRKRVLRVWIELRINVTALQWRHMGVMAYQFIGNSALLSITCSAQKRPTILDLFEGNPPITGKLFQRDNDSYTVSRSWNLNWMYYCFGCKMNPVWWAI